MPSPRCKRSPKFLHVENRAGGTVINSTKIQANALMPSTEYLHPKWKYPEGLLSIIRRKYLPCLQLSPLIRWDLTRMKMIWWERCFVVWDRCVWYRSGCTCSGACVSKYLIIHLVEYVIIILLDTWRRWTRWAIDCVSQLYYGMSSFVCSFLYNIVDASTLNEPSIPYKDFLEKLTAGDVTFVEFMVSAHMS